jgi:hypothetical protein
MSQEIEETQLFLIVNFAPRNGHNPAITSSLGGGNAGFA